MQVTTNRVLTRLPASELSRRRDLVRAHLRERNLDALIVLGSDDGMGGYVRWFLDRPAYGGYHLAVVFYPEDLMTIVEHGAIGSVRLTDGEEPDYPGVGEVLQTAAFSTIRYLQGAEGELVAAALTRRGCKRIALAGMGAMPADFLAAVTAVPGVEIFDETAAINQMKVIKSAVEIAEIRKTAIMQDDIFRHVLDNARPGMRDVDIVALAQAEGRRLGGEGGAYLCGSAAPGEPALFRMSRWQHRTINPGDAVTLVIENNGPSGYFTHVGRTIVFGRAGTELQDAFDIARSAQTATVERMVPGAACADVAAAHDALYESLGLPVERRLYAHGQGYDAVESPLIRYDEPGHLAAGMNIGVHPSFATEHAFGYICDNYLIGEGGTERLHFTEQKLFEVG